MKNHRREMPVAIPFIFFANYLCILPHCFPFPTSYATHNNKANHMGKEGQSPGHRVGHINRLDTMILRYLKNRGKPHQTKRAGAKKRYNHRHNRAPHTAQGPYHNVHHTTQGIDTTDVHKAHHTGLHYRRIVGIK